MGHRAAGSRHVAHRCKDGLGFPSVLSFLVPSCLSYSPRHRQASSVRACSGQAFMCTCTVLSVQAQALAQAQAQYRLQWAKQRATKICTTRCSIRPCLGKQGGPPSTRARIQHARNVDGLSPLWGQSWRPGIWSVLEICAILDGVALVPAGAGTRCHQCPRFCSSTGLCNLHRDQP